MAERTYTHSWNTAPINETTIENQAASFAYQAKEFLKTIGGTVVASCNSSAVNPTGDNWASITDITFNASGSAHSWAVIESPEGVVYGANGTRLGAQSRVWVLIDCSSLLSPTPRIIISMHRVAPTGGTTTSAPSSTNVIGSTLTQFLRTPVAPSVFSFSGTTLFDFYLAVNPIGAHYHLFCSWFFVTSDTKLSITSGKYYPYNCGYIVKYNDAAGGVNGSVLSNATRGWQWDGAAFTQIGFAALCTSGGAIMGSGFPSTGDSIDSQHPRTSLYLYCPSTGFTSYIGRVADYQVSGSSVTQNTVDSETSPTRIFLGQMFLPANVTSVP